MCAKKLTVNIFITQQNFKIFTTNVKVFIYFTKLRKSRADT